MKNSKLGLAAVAVSLLTLVTGCVTTSTTATTTTTNVTPSANVIGATTREIVMTESMRIPIIKADPSLTDTQKQCVDDIDLTQVAKPVQAILLSDFTTDELAQLDAFFASEASKANSRATREQIAIVLSGREINSGITLTAEQQAEVDSFSNSALGKKYEQATQSNGEIGKTIDGFVKQATANCGVSL